MIIQNRSEKGKNKKSTGDEEVYNSLHYSNLKGTNQTQSSFKLRKSSEYVIPPIDEKAQKLNIEDRGRSTMSTFQVDKQKNNKFNSTVASVTVTPSKHFISQLA